MKRRRRIVGELHVGQGRIVVERDGSREERTLDYHRVEYSDGTFEESGVPPGMKPRPSTQQLWDWFFGVTR